MSVKKTEIYRGLDVSGDLIIVKAYDKEDGSGPKVDLEMYRGIGTGEAICNVTAISQSLVKAMAAGLGMVEAPVSSSTWVAISKDELLGLWNTPIRVLTLDGHLRLQGTTSGGSSSNGVVSQMTFREEGSGSRYLSLSGSQFDDARFEKKVRA